jgi:hypothetical protein
MSLIPYDWPDLLSRTPRRRYPSKSGPPYKNGATYGQVPPPYDPDQYSAQVGQIDVEDPRSGFENRPLVWSSLLGASNPYQGPIGEKIDHDTYQGAMFAELPQTGLLDGTIGGQQNYPPIIPEEQGTAGGSASPWDAMTQEAMDATRPKQPGLFGGGGKGINMSLLPLLEAGLGMMAQSGWQKMPVSVGQAIGKGAYPSVKTQLEQNKWDEQRGMREEELNIRRMTGEAYRDQLKSQQDERAANALVQKEINGLVQQYQSIPPNDPLAAEKRWQLAQQIAMKDKTLRDEWIKGEYSARKPQDLDLKKFPLMQDGKPVIHPTTGDQVFEQYWVDKQGNKIKKEDGTVVGSGGVRVQVGGSNLFNKDKDAYDIEKDLSARLEAQTKDAKSGMALSKQFDAAINLGTPSGYKAAATIAQKLIEPGNQALINEISRLEGGGDLVQRVAGSLSQFVAGTPSQQQISDLKKFAKAMENAYANQAIKARKNFRSLAEQYGQGNPNINPKRVVMPDEELDAWEALSE